MQTFLFGILMVLCAAVAILAGVGIVREFAAAQAIIRATLQQRGATAIKLQHRWLDWHPQTFTFHVDYLDAEGSHQHTVAKTRWGLRPDKTIYWQDER